VALEVIMPRLTHDMQAGVLLEWYKGEGDEVQKGEPLFAVETDKATVDVEAYAAGVLRGLRFESGDAVPVGKVMGWIVDPGEEIPEVGPASGHAGAGPRDVAEKPGFFPSGPTSRVPDPWAGGRIVASPVAKRLAEQHGVDVGQIEGRGPHGRVTKADVENYLAQRATAHGCSLSAAAALAPGELPYDVVPLPKLRQTTGERMLTSVRTAPHFDLEAEVDMSEASRWRARYAEEGGARVSYTALFVKVVAHALREHRQLNAALLEGELRVYREINVGVATAMPEGLVVPVVRGADGMNLHRIQETITRLREGAGRLKFAPDELQGGTFTLSNLGMYGVDAFRAIINPPQAAILAIGRIIERVIGVEGQIVLRPTVRLVLSVDHRVVDGAQAAHFLAAVRRYLENPYLLL
jgi:pyruvate dehydrogenase E2 component (dihydrolipoamide acetyltransferase)